MGGQATQLVGDRSFLGQHLRRRHATYACSRYLLRVKVVESFRMISDHSEIVSGTYYVWCDPRLRFRRLVQVCNPLVVIPKQKNPVRV